jgi:hypothetical protein
VLDDDLAQPIRAPAEDARMSAVRSHRQRRARPSPSSIAAADSEDALHRSVGPPSAAPFYIDRATACEGEIDRVADERTRSDAGPRHDP